MTTRLAIVLSHPVQYYSPWFKWIAQHTDLNLKVFYLWNAGIKATRDSQFNATFAWDVDLLSGYDHEFVPNTATQPGTEHFNGLRNPSLLNRLKSWRPDAILLFGYNYRTHVTLIAWARFRRLPLIFRGDSHLLGRPHLPWVKRAVLHMLYRQFSAIACVGSANRDYFKTLGVPSQRLFLAPHCVDADRFRPTPQIQMETDQLRAQLGLTPKTKVILFAGKFVPAKQPRELLAAYLAICPRDWALVFVGDGEERPVLQALADQTPESNIHFLPFANQSEMPSRYLLADLFVLPSRGLYETWGLAVNEAMHMGVPCLVSNRVGCQRDLVIEGKTGWVFNATDTEALTTRLTVAIAALNDPVVGQSIRKEIAALIQQFTYAQTTDGLCDAIASLANSK